MIELLGLLLGAIGTLLAMGSGIFWWNQQSAQKEVKKYAAEREFGHIKNSLLQMANNLADEFQDLELTLNEIKSDIQEIKFECRIDNKNER